MLLIKKSTFKKLVEFCVDSGYIIAHYQRENDGEDWKLVSEIMCNDDLFSPNTVILCSSSDGSSINYNETSTEDKKNVFRLHNNFNLPKVIPCIKNVVQIVES